MADDEHRAVAEALNAHLSGSGDWSKATPAMAEVAIAALDRVRDARGDDEGRPLAEFQEGLTRALNRHGVPAMPSWDAAIDWLAEHGARSPQEDHESHLGSAVAGTWEVPRPYTVHGVPQGEDHEADERALGTPLGARQRAQTQRDVADILEFGSPQGEDPTDNPTDKPPLQYARSPQGDERRAEVEAATDALLEDSGLPRYGGHRATIERRMTIAFEAADGVRDARGDDEANTHWRCTDCNCINREDEAFCFRCGAGRPEFPARSPQSEGHEA